MTAQHTQLIDTRPSAEFNGWPGPQVSAADGGHLPGAVSLPARWLPGLTDLELAQLLERKQLARQLPTELYGSQQQVTSVAARLRTLGFEALTLTLDWYQPELELQRLENYQYLVPVPWLQARLDELDAPLVIEVDWGLPKRYLLGHIPSALYLDTNRLESLPLWNRLTPQALGSTLRELGITPERQVVLYGRDTTAAARAAQLMMYMGVKDVRLLDGGWQAWVDAGAPRELFSNQPEPSQATVFAAPLPARPELIIDLEQAWGYLQQESSELVSIRSWAEYSGQTSGYSYIRRAGRIDGALWGQGGSDAYHMQAYRNPDNTMRAYTELASMWRERGITPDKQLAFFCGTGWRASEAFFYAYLMGWQNISVYDGGWYEWSLHPETPKIP